MENNNESIGQHGALPRPGWIRGKLSWDDNSGEVRKLLKGWNLNSVCVEAACPNKGECWQARHVTFMILGGVCTRGCLFCNVAGGAPLDPAPDEPRNIAMAVKKLGVKYVVITSVTRDDLGDRGAEHFVNTVREIKTNVPEVKVELLIPDLDADPGLLRKIAASGAEVIGHNIEMPEDLYPAIRPKASYRRSLDVFRHLVEMKKQGADIFLKSSIIVGLGETEEDIYRTLKDLKDEGVDIVYLGQYLSPTCDHWPVNKYYTPAEFKSLEAKAREMGFRAVNAGPMVRSSYRAYEAYFAAKNTDI